MIQPFILATAGHVDHGKSALVHALTGTDPDRLPEEKARGISIDLGFAHLRLPNPMAPTNRTGPLPTEFSCGVVDVPGHEDFVKNMVAGVGAVDVALLVVAADDGWMPQTEEHLQILLYLGVTRAVVALSKADLVPRPTDAVEAVRSRLTGTPFARAPIVPTSIPRAAGYHDLRRELARVLASAPAPPDFGKPRLPVDRVFVLRGIGTVVTGTLCGGALARGESVVIQPGGRTARIRSCQSHGTEVPRALPGTRTALHLVDVDAGELHRGDVVTQDMLGAPTRTLDVRLERSERLREHPTAARPLASETPVRLHLGSAQVPARLQLLDAKVLNPGERGLAQLRLDAPVFAFAGDRFLIRDAAERRTLAGGIVLDPEGPRSRARAPDRLESLRACALRPESPEPFVEATLRRTRCADMAKLLVRSRFSAAEIASAVDRIVASRRATRTGDILEAADRRNECVTAALVAIDHHHREHPEEPGLPLADLHSALRRQFGDAGDFVGVLDDLRRDGCTTEKQRIRRSTHRPVLPDALREAAEALLRRLGNSAFDPPPRRELVVDASASSALRHLVRTGEVVELGPEVVMSREAFALAHRRVVAHLRRRERATASELRELLTMHRRVLIPLLERLDREGVTRRDGDVRLLPARSTAPRDSASASAENPPPLTGTNRPAREPGNDGDATLPPPRRDPRG